MTKQEIYAQALGIKQMISDGKSQTQILEKYNICEKTLRNRCALVGVSWWMKLPQKERDPERYAAYIKTCTETAKKQGHNHLSEETFAQQVRKRSNGRLEYVRGFINTDGRFIGRCTKCGAEKEYSCKTIRNAWFKESVQCQNCIDIQIEQRRKKKLTKKLTEKTARSFKRNQIVGKQIEFAICRQCGEVFVPDRRDAGFCSDKCRTKYHNSYGSHTRRRLISERTKDKGITVEKLFKRDRGRCYLCGFECDWDDAKVENGAFIAGDKYPSIEHVIPLSKGGEHSWSNVKLACRRCNYLKSDAPLSV